MKKLFQKRIFKLSFLNFLSIVVKGCTSFVWLLTNNPAFLGVYSLLSAPPSIIQMTAIASEIGFAEIPSIDPDEEGRVLSMSLLIDLTLLAVAAVCLTLFFLLTHAKILSELRWGFYCLAVGVAFVEPVCSTALYSSIARQRARWFFYLSNARPLGLILVLITLVASGAQSAASAALVFVVFYGVGLATSLLYFERHRPRLFEKGLSRWFLATFKKHLFQILVFRVGKIAFTSFSALFIAFMGDPGAVGVFSYAWTLSNFVQLGIAPVIQQLYSPRVSLLSRDDPRQELKRILANSVLLAGLASVALSVLTYFAIPFVVKLLGRTKFLSSVPLLPSLMTFQVFTLMAFLLIHYLYSARLYLQVAAIYLTATAGGFVWIKLAHSADQKIYSFPILGVMVFALSALMTAIKLRDRANLSQAL